MSLAVPVRGATPAMPEDLEWEQTDCPMCRSRQSSVVLEAEDPQGIFPGMRFTVVECDDCGLRFTNPRPSPASIARFYSPDYGPHQGCGLSEAKRRRVMRRGRKPARWYLKRPANRGLPWHGQGRLLDFGCGSGRFLEMMRLQGWQVTGLDISEETVLRIRRELEVPAFAGTLPHPSLGAEQFDVVTLWHSLEHVHRPREVLDEVWKLLVPGGKVVVGVPNIASAPFDWFGSAWFCLDVPRHLTHFTPDTLKQMAEAVGFEVETLRCLSNKDWLRQSARRALGQGHPGPTWLRWKWLARPVAGYLSWTGRSDSLLLIAEKPVRLERRYPRLIP